MRKNSIEGLMKFKQVDSVHFMPAASAVLTVTASNRGNNSTKDDKDLMKGFFHVQNPKTQQLHYVPWGYDNLFPVELINLSSKNNITQGIINTKIDFITGKKVFVYEEVLTNENKIEIIPLIDNEINDWLEENEIDDFIGKRSTDDVWLGNTFHEVIRSKSKNKIAKIKHIDATLCRAGRPDKNKKVDRYLIGDWINGYNDYIEIPKYDPLNPFRYSNTVCHTKRYFPGSYHYGLPDWIGSENWIRTANKIPVFHERGLSNTYQIRWHIEIPEDYFGDLNFEEQKKEEKRLREEMEDFLAGEENAGKAFTSKYGTDHNGQAKPGWKISPVKPELFDDAFVKLYEQSNVAIASSHGIDPSIAGIQTQGKLSSGSDKRISYDMFLKLKVPPFRKRTLQPIYDAKKANKWNKKAKFGIIDYELTTLDDTHKGGREVVSN